MLERAAHEQEAPRWLYYVIGRHYNARSPTPPVTPTVLAWGPRPDAGMWTEELLMRRHLDLLRAEMAAHQSRRLLPQVWVVGRPHHFGDLGRDPHHSRNLEEFQGELARWERGKFGFDPRRTGLRIFPASVLDAWLAPRHTEVPSEMACDVEVLSSSDDSTAWVKNWFDLEPDEWAPKGPVSLCVADASFAPHLVPAGWVVRVLHGPVRSRSTEPPHPLAGDEYALDQAWRGTVLRSMPPDSHVVLPGEPMKNRVEASEISWTRYLEVRDFYQELRDEGTYPPGFSLALKRFKSRFKQAFKDRSVR